MNSSKQINTSRHMPGVHVWQRGYYDHIIRNEQSLKRIGEYIRTNPERWQMDRENPDRSDANKIDRQFTEEDKRNIPAE